MTTSAIGTPSAGTIADLWEIPYGVLNAAAGESGITMPRAASSAVDSAALRVRMIVG
jgi:hypothetical protein